MQPSPAGGSAGRTVDAAANQPERDNVVAFPWASGPVNRRATGQLGMGAGQLGDRVGQPRCYPARTRQRCRISLCDQPGAQRFPAKGYTGRTVGAWSARPRQSRGRRTGAGQFGDRVGHSSRCAPTIRISRGGPKYTAYVSTFDIGSLSWISNSSDCPQSVNPTNTRTSENRSNHHRSERVTHRAPARPAPRHSRHLSWSRVWILPLMWISKTPPRPDPEHAGQGDGSMKTPPAMATITATMIANHALMRDQEGSPESAFSARARSPLTGALGR